MTPKLEQKTIDALGWIIDILNQCKVDYQISGGFAGKVFGSTRQLHDIDIDILEKDFEKIFPYISDFIVFGPGHYKDEKWDLKLITLNYKGQEIDISAVDTILISNKERTAWVPVVIDFSKTLQVSVNGIDIKVINPKDFIAYKAELDGEHQLEDIESAKMYIHNHLEKIT